MAEPLTRTVLPFVSLFMLMAASWADAESLVDPTRPPPNLAGAGGAAIEETGSGLQSVLISSGRKSAIIGGQVVGLGEKYGDARVVKITESEVVLQSGTTKEILRLFPDVDKRPARAVKQRKVSRDRPRGDGAK